MRIGQGYDAHALAPGRSLVLGGVHVPFDAGLEGWSDGDVLTHAVIDALLGATAAGDIGGHFPSGDLKYKGISSLKLLEEVREILRKGGFRVVNIDATVIADSPRLAGHIAAMRANLGRALGIEADQVSVKAASGNGLGFVGREEGIAAQAVALIEGGKHEDFQHPLR